MREAPADAAERPQAAESAAAEHDEVGILRRLDQGRDSVGVAGGEVEPARLERGGVDFVRSPAGGDGQVSIFQRGERALTVFAALLPFFNAVGFVLGSLFIGD